jgi:uncharacterized membrane protein HdeD (DUF308 family)
MDTSVTPVATVWWAFLVAGLVSIAAGILAIVFPDITLLALGIFIGVGLLFAGALDIAAAVGGAPDSRALSAIVGVVTIIAGVVCLRRPGESLIALVVVLGIYLIVTGIVRFIRAFAELEDRALQLGLALVDVILGVLILALPGVSLVTLAILFALALLARGAFMVLVGFRMRSAGKAAPA